MTSAPIRDQTSRIVALIGAALGSYLLINQGIETISARLGEGDSWIGAILHYLSFLTILTNGALVAVYLWFLSQGRIFGWMGNPNLHAFFVALALLAGATWHVLLLPDEGLSFNGVGFHYVAPALFALWWALRKPTKKAGFLGVTKLMLLPLGYAGWSLARGALTGEYPYDFVDAGEIGYPATLSTMGALLVAQWVLAMTFTAIARFRSGRGA